MASILSAAAKSVSTGFRLLTSACVSTPPTEAASAPRFRRFGGSLVQTLVQTAKPLAATSDRFPLGTLVPRPPKPKVAGSTPAGDTFLSPAERNSCVLVDGRQRGL